jgi:GNAT superfamily N-acetyltransferase
MMGAEENGLEPPCPFVLERVSADDAEHLVALRIAAMRESLERVGRFDLQRARERFLADFAVECTRHVIVESERAGLIVLRAIDSHLLLDHFYLHPRFQGRGIGSAVLKSVCGFADAVGRPLHLYALRESAVNRLYVRHEFELIDQSEFDNHYVRAPRPFAED